MAYVPLVVEGCGDFVCWEECCQVMIDTDLTRPAHSVAEVRPMFEVLELDVPGTYSNSYRWAPGLDPDALAKAVEREFFERFRLAHGLPV